MLHLLTSDEFAEWFAALDDRAAEEVATALELVEQLGPGRAAPGSSEYLLWYEHERARELFELEDWATFYGDAKQMVANLESSRFVGKLRAVAREDAAAVTAALRQIKIAAGVPRRALTLKVRGASPPAASSGDEGAELRRWYRLALGLTGLDVTDFPVHSSALRELTLRGRDPGLRLLYGVDTARDLAFVALGEWLDRAFYGHSVRRAERLWKQFLEGNLRAPEPAPFR